MKEYLYGLLTAIIIWLINKAKLLLKINICPKCRKNLLYVEEMNYGLNEEKDKIKTTRTLKCKKCKQEYGQYWDFDTAKWTPDLIL